MSNTRRRDGVRWRRHTCLVCDRRWSSWQSVVDPRSINPREIDLHAFEPAPRINR